MTSKTRVKSVPKKIAAKAVEVVPVPPPPKPPEKSRRGGARPGAGRKSKAVEGVRLNNKAIAEAVAAALKAQGELPADAELEEMLAKAAAGGEITQEQKTTIANMARVYAPAAIRTIVRNLRSKSDIARQRAADSLLDRGFGKPAQTMDLKADLSVTTNLAERVQRAKKRAQKS